jgi:hypothetical protein
MAVLVMLNNYTHDLATAVFAVSALAAWLVLRSDAVKQAPRALRPLVQGLVKIGTISFVVTLLLGAVRSARSCWERSGRRPTASTSGRRP